MSVSHNLVLHLLGFGVLVTALLAGFLVERKFRSEPDLELKLYADSFSRTIGLLSPLAVLILLATGVVNIYNRYAGSPMAWYQEGWLVAKVIFFAMMMLNGLVFGPRISRSRLKLVKQMREGITPENSEHALKSLNGQMMLFYLVQTLILIVVLYLSVYGSANHSGAL